MLVLTDENLDESNEVPAPVRPFIQMETGALKNDQAHGGALSAALEREHREIDEGINAFRAPAAGESEAEADGRVRALKGAMDALRRHIYLEEEFLFPPMQAGFAIPIGVMLREHGEIWRTLDALDEGLARATGRR